MTSVLDRSGKLLVNPVDALGRWREYFEELLNVGENTFSNVSNFDVQWDSNDEGNRITLEDVKRMVSRLQCNKAAGVDEIKSGFIDLEKAYYRVPRVSYCQFYKIMEYEANYCKQLKVFT